MSLHSEYSVAAYGRMIADGVRGPAYVEAMRDAIRPGSVVLDLGAGPGFFSVLACQLGARRVYAVEPNEAVQVGPALARENGCADRITFLKVLSTEVTLPEPADVIVSDLRGALPFYRHHIPSLADARRRLLAPGGVLLPRRDTLWAAPVEAPAIYTTILSGWEGNDLGVSTESVRRKMANRYIRPNADVKAEQLLAAPVEWGTLDYATIEDTDHRADLDWTVERAGTCHGVVAWFEAVVADGVTYSTAPGQPEAVYGRAFFPWLRPVAVEAGDRVQVTLNANLIGDDYVWRWASRVTSADGTPTAEFRQSSLSGSLLSADHQRRRAFDYRPQRSEAGEVALYCLTQMDAARTVEDLAQELAERFPGQFPTEQAALEHASNLSGKYGL